MCTLYRLLLLRKCAFNQLPPIIWSEQLLRHKFVTNRLSLSSLCFLSSWNNARKRGRKTQKKKYCSDFSFQDREAVTLVVWKPRKYPSKWPSTIVGTCKISTLARGAPMTILNKTLDLCPTSRSSSTDTSSDREGSLDYQQRFEGNITYQSDMKRHAILSNNSLIHYGYKTRSLRVLALTYENRLIKKIQTIP